MPDFARRTMAPELMDDATCGPEEFRRCLVDLATVNRLTLAYRPTLDFLARASRRAPPGRPLRILDVGGGYGDALRQLDAWAARHDLTLDMTSIDLSPWARAAAQSAPPTRRPITWITGDVFDHRPDEPPDLVISSLFTHHLEDEAVVRFIAWMERTAALGWFVNDLHRHPVPYHAFRALSAAAGWHRFVRHDGPISIARAFTRQEWLGLLTRAGLPAGSARITWWMPFRICVSRLRE